MLFPKRVMLIKLDVYVFYSYIAEKWVILVLHKNNSLTPI